MKKSYRYVEVNHAYYYYCYSFEREKLQFLGYLVVSDGSFLYRVSVFLIHEFIIILLFFPYRIKTIRCISDYRDIFAIWPIINKKDIIIVFIIILTIVLLAIVLLSLLYINWERKNISFVSYKEQWICWGFRQCWFYRLVSNKSNQPFLLAYHYLHRVGITSW